MSHLKILVGLIRFQYPYRYSKIKLHTSYGPRNRTKPDVIQNPTSNFMVECIALTKKMYIITFFKSAYRTHNASSLPASCAASCNVSRALRKATERQLWKIPSCKLLSKFRNRLEVTKYLIKQKLRTEQKRKNKQAGKLIKTVVLQPGLPRKGKYSQPSGIS